MCLTIARVQATVGMGAMTVVIMRATIAVITTTKCSKGEGGSEGQG